MGRHLCMTLTVWAAGGGSIGAKCPQTPGRTHPGGIPGIDRRCALLRGSYALDPGLPVTILRQPSKEVATVKRFLLPERLRTVRSTNPREHFQTNRNTRKSHREFV